MPRLSRSATAVAVFEIVRWVAAPREPVWPIVSDLERYAHVAPNLSAAHVIEGSVLGTRRRCYNTGGRSSTETRTLWDDPNWSLFIWGWRFATYSNEQGLTSRLLSPDELFVGT
ncbi:MAG: hypothetical protein GEU73_14070 [Chloroflexi bacterium]|nr:hypothetical protein [Chloroflexota bacterium]